MATPPSVVRGALTAVAASAAADFLPLVTGDQPGRTRSALLEVAPAVTGLAVEGSAALAADWYEDLREEARPRRRHLTVVPDWQAERFGQAVAWATAPLLDETPNLTLVRSRLWTVTEHEVFSGFTDTTEANVRADPEAVGWKRVARDSACPFCRMLAERGAVYRKEATANFSAHTGGPRGGGVCRCTVVAVFRGGEQGPEASVVQYTASKRRPTAKDRQRVYDYLRANYGGI